MLSIIKIVRFERYDYLYSERCDFIVFPASIEPQTAEHIFSSRFGLTTHLRQSPPTGPLAFPMVDFTHRLKTHLGRTAVDFIVFIAVFRMQGY